MSPEHDVYIRQSIQLARESVQMNNHPFGALLVLNGKVILEAKNSVCSDQDPTRHAEMNLVSLAARTLSKDQIKATTLYSSTEPCAMCIGAIYWVGIRHIVYACSQQKLAEYANEKFSCEDILHEGPVLESEASLTHATFWRTLEN